MDVQDLYSLVRKIAKAATEHGALTNFEQFSNAINRVLRQGQRGEPVPTEQLFTALKNLGELDLTYNERKLAETLHFDNLVGEKAVASLEEILRDQNFDPSGVTSQVAQKLEDFREFLKRVDALRSGLKGYPIDRSNELTAGEARLQITFTDGAAVETIVDFEKWIDAWAKILRAFVMSAGGRPDDSRVVYVQKASPLLIEIATIGAAVVTLGKAADMVLEKIERYLRIQRQIEEIRKLKLENRKIAADLRKELERFSEKSAEQIAEQLADGPADGEIRNGLKLAVKDLFLFVEKGGRIDCPDTADEETSETTAHVYEKVRKLQHHVDQLRLPFDAHDDE